MAETRRDNLIHHTSTKFSARKPALIVLQRPYFARFLFWMKAFIVPSGSSGILVLIPTVGGLKLSMGKAP